MKQWAINILLLILCVSAILTALLKVTPFEITADTYVGTIVTLLSISVAFVIGYQIYNAIELKKDIAEQKDNYHKILAENAEMKKMQHELDYQMKENSEVFSALMQMEKGLFCAAFNSMHHSLLYGLESKRDDYEWAFLCLRNFIANINFKSFANGVVALPNGILKITDSGECSGKSLKSVVDKFIELIKLDEKEIRSHEDFCKMKIEYDRVMRIFYRRMDEIVTQPERQLTPEEQDAIINPQ